jgi:hypothetical protein
MKPRFLLLAPLLAALLLAGGCGDSSSSTATDTGGALSKDEWIEQADAICLATAEELGPLAEASARILEGPETEETLARLAHYTRVAADDAERELEQLRALSPPAGDGPAIEAILGPSEANVAAIAKYGDAIETEDLRRYEALQRRAQRLKAQAGGRARAYGLRVCASGDE